MKEILKTTIRVQGRGDTKQKAIAVALNSIQGTILKNTSNIVLRIEPLDISINRAEKEVRIEKFLFLFLPRRRETYFIELDAHVEVRLLKVEEIAFVEIKKNTLLAK